MSSPPSTSPSSFSSGAGAVKQVPGLPSTHSGPPPSSPITPPSDSNRGTVAQPRCSTDNPVLAPLVAPQAKSFSAPTPTRTTPSTPERESLFAGQHTAHQRSSLQVALQLGLSLLGFVYQDKQGPISNSDTTQCVDSRRVFVCSSLHPVEYQEEGRRHTTPSDFCCSCLVRLALARELPSLCRLLTKTSPQEQILLRDLPRFSLKDLLPMHREVGDHPTRRSIAFTEATR